MVMQGLEDGRLVDGTGHSVSTRSAVFVFTATASAQQQQRKQQQAAAAAAAASSGVKVGAKAAQHQQRQAFSSGAAAEGLEFGGGEQKSGSSSSNGASAGGSGRLANTVQEIAARVDDVIWLNDLKSVDLRSILDLQLDQAAAAAAVRHGIVIEVDEGAREAVVQEALRLGRGARPVAQLVRKCVLAPLAEALLAKGGGGEGCRALVSVARGGAIKLELMC